MVTRMGGDQHDAPWKVDRRPPMPYVRRLLVVGVG
jgi:hypothetical protein